jgi:hypothetical protein
VGASGAELMRELSAQPVPYLGNAQELVQMRLGYSVYCIVTWYIYTRQALHGKAARVAAPRVVPAVTVIQPGRRRGAMRRVQVWTCEARKVSTGNRLEITGRAINLTVRTPEVWMILTDH